MKESSTSIHLRFRTPETAIPELRRCLDPYGIFFTDQDLTRVFSISNNHIGSAAVRLLNAIKLKNKKLWLKLAELHFRVNLFRMTDKELAEVWSKNVVRPKSGHAA